MTCIFAALCYAEFASMVPVAGSAYTYAYATLGELFAWIIGWDLVLEYAVGVGDRGARLVRTTFRSSLAQLRLHRAARAGTTAPFNYCMTSRPVPPRFRSDRHRTSICPPC